MYNFFYARLLRMSNLFPAQADMLAAQAAYYETLAGPFGLPLANFSTGAMPEWQSFFAAATIPAGAGGAPLPPAAARVFDSFLLAANATNFRAPMTDYFDARTAAHSGKYRGRPVLGGVWAAAAVAAFDALPPLPHEAPMAAAFARGHARAAAGVNKNS
jgi:hypothetical protein